jgi:GxxExxY protein
MQGSLLYPDLSYTVQGCIFDIRKQYGPGQKEIVYNRLLIEKLTNKGLLVEREKRINIYSQDSGKVVGTYTPDLVIENKIIVEIKSSSFTTQMDEKQLYHYLRNSSYELGYLVNFSTPDLYIKRIIYTNDRKPYLTFRVV